jgi:hypothetical protein
LGRLAAADRALQAVIQPSLRSMKRFPFGEFPTPERKHGTMDAPFAVAAKAILEKLGESMNFSACRINSR